MSNDEQEQSGFKVTDKRSFTEDGEIRSTAPEESPPERPTDPPREAAAPVGQQGRENTQAPPSIDLSSFVLSLATTAVMHMGEGPPGHPEATPQNLEASKQMIDILGMLYEKTEGNRTPEETRLLDDILYDLRLKFLTKSNSVQL